MIKCQTVLIKFVEKGLPAQEVRALTVSGCKYIVFSEGAKFLNLVFVTSEGSIVKHIGFAVGDVKEYVLEGIVWDVHEGQGIPVPIIQSTYCKGCNYNFISHEGYVIHKCSGSAL